ncbi:MAG: bacteriohopanetetrol glucosamine biosynthesis glycosyltransferase HpnI [Acidobacteriia bacterium]|nr:bacteriohopanetetrol glucosamine biosynthesis glycosyltransferase HpnI [Terriglobia bacterium]
MTSTTSVVFEAATALGTIASLSFYLLGGVGLASFLSARRRKSGRSNLADGELPPVSILKPLRGVDPQIWESFCSHCEQDYPEFQIVFGVSDPNDPAIEVVRRLQAQYPQRQIELIACQRILGANIKVSNLVQMLPAARHEILLVSDSDIRVPEHYLRRVIAPLCDESVGLVTCLYRGIAGRSLGSQLEALGISMDFVPGVLSARVIERGIHFALGSTMVFRKSDLDALGGFEILVDYLADDYELGRGISAAGKRVELSDVAVETFLPAYSFRQFVDHQLRWARTIRDARRWGYLGLALTFSLPWSIALLLAARGALWAWALAAITLAARVGVGVATSFCVLHDGQALRNIVLLPMRDLIAPLVWAASFAGHQIHWRGDAFYLKDGRLTRIPPKSVGE